MLDKILKAVSLKLTTHADAVREQRATIERERAGTTARAHAATILRNTEGYSTSLRKMAENAQKEYARARCEWEAEGASLVTLATTLIIARERRDEAVRAHRESEEAEALRKATKIHPEVRACFNIMFRHGVDPRHLANVRPETIAIISDLFLWDGHDPEMVDPGSPMREVFEIYAARSILMPGQLGRQIAFSAGRSRRAGALHRSPLLHVRRASGVLARRRGDRSR